MVKIGLRTEWRSLTELLLIVLLGMVALTLPVSAQGVNRVGLVVDPGNGNIISMPVSFSTDQITGIQVLEQSGLDLGLTSSMGAGVAVCTIDNVGCPISNCFCQAPANYWSYWHLTDGAWVYASVGASSHRMEDGAIVGWRWGRGDPPPLLTVEQIMNETDAAPNSPGIQQDDYPAPPVVPTPRPYDGPGDPPPPVVPTQDPYGGPTAPPPDEPSPTATITPAAITPDEPTVTDTPEPGVPTATMTTAPLPESPTATPTPFGAEITAEPAEDTRPTDELEIVTPAHEEEAVGTPTPDRAAALIATGVAHQRETAAAPARQSGEQSNRQYGGFVFLGALMLLGIGYAMLLKRQRQRGAWEHDGDQDPPLD